MATQPNAVQMNPVQEGRSTRVPNPRHRRHRQRTLSLAQHHDTNTDSARSVSASPPGMFNVPQGWHLDTDTASLRSVSSATLPLTSIGVVWS